MNEIYGFKTACNEKLGPVFGAKLFDRMQKAFDLLPLACVIEKRVLVVHGGIGEGMWTLNDLKAVKRPVNSEMLSKDDFLWVNHILWSDPIEDGAESDPDIFGVHESPRRSRKACEFAWDVTKTFCARNGLSLVVRSHQCKEGSVGFEFMHENLLARVFSARDYEGHGNDGAALLIKRTRDGACGKDVLSLRPQVLRSFVKWQEEKDKASLSKPDPAQELKQQDIDVETRNKLTSKHKRNKQVMQRLERMSTAELMGVGTIG